MRRTSRSTRKRRTSTPPNQSFPLLLAAFLGVCCGLILLLVLVLTKTGTAAGNKDTSALSHTSTLSQSDDVSSLAEGTSSDQELLESEASQASSMDEYAMAPANLEASEVTGELTEEKVLEQLNSLREVFPDGAYWNHMGLDQWDEFTVTDTPCDHDVYGDTYCNSHSGGIQDLFPQYTPMIQCLGFASLLSDLVFGEDAPVETFTDIYQLRPGDSVRLIWTEHSFDVLTVDDTGITVVECNKDYEHCLISWDRFISWEELAYYQDEVECITRYGD